MGDWGTGKYEVTAEQIAPVAVIVLDAVEPVQGLKLLDLACGTGNATLLAAERGAEVTGLDAAPRLLEVGGQRATDAGLDVTWTEGNMLDLPFEDDSFDVITSVFGVIFGDPAAAVAEEVGRVLNQHGRVAITGWTGDGLLPQVAALSKRAVSDALDLPPDEQKPFDWGDELALRELFSEHGIALQCEKQDITFRADSAVAARDEWADNHPIWLNVKEAIGEENFATLADEILAVLEEGNESADGTFSYTSSYLLAVGSPV